MLDQMTSTGPSNLSLSVRLRLWPYVLFSWIIFTYIDAVDYFYNYYEKYLFLKNYIMIYLDCLCITIVE